MDTSMKWTASGLTLDRADAGTLVSQIVSHIEAAIAIKSLQGGRRLPSWNDLAAQLGVSRGTVRAAYDRLADKELIATHGRSGTRVVDALPPRPRPVGQVDVLQTPPEIEQRGEPPLPFQMGIPAQDAFPATVWARLHRQAIHITALRNSHSDPRGMPELRRALAAHVALARGVECSPDQIIITSGYRAGLALTLAAIGASGHDIWIEDPGYPVARQAIELAGARAVAIPVDQEGIDVAFGEANSPDALMAVVTPGQQAPTGVTLSEGRRLALKQWAVKSGGWIVEDDYLAELHLGGRSAPALASGPGCDRVIHIGTFSKTISPALGLGFVVAPIGLTRRMVEVAALIGTPPSPAIQSALATFLIDGHYLRHLRRMRRLYVARRDCLVQALGKLGADANVAGLSVILPLPPGACDGEISDNGREIGLAISSYSTWFNSIPAKQGLVLGIANVLERSVATDCKRLLTLVGTLGTRPRPTQSKVVPSNGTVDLMLLGSDVEETRRLELHYV